MLAEVADDILRVAESPTELAAVAPMSVVRAEVVMIESPVEVLAVVLVTVESVVCPITEDKLCVDITEPVRPDDADDSVVAEMSVPLEPLRVSRVASVPEISVTLLRRVLPLI